MTPVGLAWIAFGLMNVVVTSRRTFSHGFTNWAVLSAILFVTGPLGSVLTLLMLMGSPL